MKPILRYTILLGLILAVCVLDGCAIDALQFNKKGRIHFHESEYPQAVQMLTKSIDLDYESSSSHYWLGKCYQAQGSMEKSIWEFELAVRFDPSMDKAQIAWFISLYKHGEVEKSYEIATNFLRHKEAPAKNFAKLGMHLLRIGMKDHGLMAFGRAKEVEPYNALPMVMLADYFLEQGNKENEIKYLVEAFQANPLYPDLGRRLGKEGYRVEIPKQLAPRPIQEQLVPIQKTPRKKPTEGTIF